MKLIITGGRQADSKIENTIDLENYKMNWVFSILKY